MTSMKSELEQLAEKCVATRKRFQEMKLKLVEARHAFDEVEKATIQAGDEMRAAHIRLDEYLNARADVPPISSFMDDNDAIWATNRFGKAESAMRFINEARELNK